MSSTTLLKKLLRASLARNTNPKLFASLLEQLLAREQISDAELGETLLNVADSSVKSNSTTSILARRLQIEYVLEFAFSSSENLARFFKLLPQLSLKSQLKYILYFKTQAGKIIDRSLINEFYNGLAQFTIATSPSRPGECSPHSNRLWYHVVFVWGAFIDLDSSIPENPSLKESFQKMALFAGDLEDDYIGALISRKFGAAADPGASLNFQTTRMAKSEEAPTTMPEKSLSLNLNGKKYLNYVSLKKFIWLNFHFQLWKMDTEMSRAFMTFFNLQDLSHTDLAKELICSFLNGAAVAVRLGEEPYVIFNWKNFILTHLAQDLKKIVLSSHAVDHEWHETVSAAITSCKDLVITETKIGGAKESYNLNKEFMRSCLHQELISLEKYIQVFPSEAENLSTSILAHEIENLRLTELITAEFKSRLENVNPEFTSLQESNLIDYFKNLPLTNFRFLKAKQCKLAQLSENLIDNIVREKNNEKLRWISLVFLNVPSIANFIFYQSRKGPWMFLSKIINYIDSESFNVDEDDGNFQDTYACFGVILTSVISVAAFFGIEFSSLGLKNSYTIDYINQFYFRLCDMLTNTYTGASEQEKQIISNYENLVTEWANALFDVNNEGLSDDLLKSVNVKQIYKFVFFLFREAFTARAMGMLSESSLNNGIDYLSQNFLAPCSLEAMQWIASKISPQQNNNDIMVEMMLRIIEGNFGDAMSTDKSEQIFTSRMILNAISPRLLKKLKSFTGASATENIEKLSSILVKETNVEYCQYVDHPKHESSLMGDTMTNDLLNFLKKSKLASPESISEAWLKIKHKWRTLSANEACFTLLQQIEHNLGARGSMAYEDSKFIVDFFMFMITGSSSQDAGDISSLVDCLNCARPPKAPIFEAEKQFALTINDHHSSIFNENASTSSLNSPLQEENPRLREELMGDFEMGDLFEDMSEGFFDELMALTNDPASSKPFVDVSDVYKQSVKHLSLLWRISECMVSPEFLEASSLISIARASLIEELRKWSPRL